MLVDFFKASQECFPFAHDGVRTFQVPTTYVSKGEAISLSGGGELFRVLTPKGGETAANLNAALDKWGTIAIQQLLSAADVIFTASSSSAFIISCYQDFFEEMKSEEELLPNIRLCIKALATQMAEHFGELVRLKGFIYRGSVFIYEVAPEFLYSENIESTFSYYASQISKKSISIVEMLRRIKRYHSFFEGRLSYKKLAAYALDWVVKETGMGSFVGIIDGTNTADSLPGQGIRPQGRLYRISGLAQIPEFEPVTDQVALVLTADVVSTDRLDTVWTALERKLETWDCLKNAVLYLDGIASQEEFEAVCKKLKPTPSVGVCVSTWGQLFSLLETPLKSSHSFIIDADSMAEDGVFAAQRRKLGVKATTGGRLGRVLRGRKLGYDISLLYSGDMDLAELIDLCSSVDCIYTTAEVFNTAVLCLATSKVEAKT